MTKNQEFVKEIALEMRFDFKFIILIELILLFLQKRYGNLFTNNSTTNSFS